MILAPELFDIHKDEIVVDVDDVLARYVKKFAAISNQEWGRPHEPAYNEEDYTENWAAFWRVPHEEMVRRYHRLDELDIAASLEPVDGALPVLRELKARGSKLTILTSRTQSSEPTTKAWLEEHYFGIFETIRHTGIFESLEVGRHKLTKGEVLREIGARCLIDDQPKHCNAAVENGVKAILFGDYGWNRNAELLPGVVRCATWQDVGEYFT